MPPKVLFGSLSTTPTDFPGILGLHNPFPPAHRDCACPLACDKLFSISRLLFAHMGGTGRNGVPVNFIDTLLAARTPLIMEIKAKSGDGIDLLRGRSSAHLAQEYERNGAPCISVVTGRWFGGSVEMLREVIDTTDRPILQKDFLTSENQLDRAHKLGVSAVLLTATLLPEAVLTSLVDAALARNMTPFVEVVSVDEIKNIAKPEKCVIAVNNKDIKTRERADASLQRSLTLLPSVIEAGSLCPVSASGINHPVTAAALLDRGYQGLLLGTALLRSHSVAGWVDEFNSAKNQFSGPYPGVQPSTP